MNADKFIKRFNEGNLKDKGILFRENEFLKKPDLRLVSKMHIGRPYKEFHFIGFSAQRIGIWYAIDQNDKRIPIKAFKIYTSGLRTWEEWAEGVPANFADHVQGIFIGYFDGVVAPESIQN